MILLWLSTSVVLLGSELNAEVEYHTSRESAVKKVVTWASEVVAYVAQLPYQYRRAATIWPSAVANLALGAYAMPKSGRHFRQSGAPDHD
jgi:hypothetical protein